MIKQWIELPRGMGKSTLLQEIIEEQAAAGRRCVLLSPFAVRRYTPNSFIIHVRSVKLIEHYHRNALIYVDEFDSFGKRDQDWIRQHLTVEVAARSVNREPFHQRQKLSTWFGQHQQSIEAWLYLAEARARLGRS